MPKWAGPEGVKYKFWNQHFLNIRDSSNGKEATVNRALDGSTYPGQNLVHSVFSKINYGVLKRNRLYLGLVLSSGG
jgi:hypothetical protein